MSNSEQTDRAPAAALIDSHPLHVPLPIERAVPVVELTPSAGLEAPVAWEPRLLFTIERRSDGGAPAGHSATPCHDLAVHHDIKTGVVVLEYASEGRVVATGAPYTNRYISVLTTTDRKVTHWRDYLDPLAVFDALGWPSR